jgi:RNA polymerase sigma factor (TIGR02999 family)
MVAVLRTSFAIVVPFPPAKAETDGENLHGHYNDRIQDSRDVTGLLVAWRQGDPGALEHLMPLVHRELQELARRKMAAERSGHTLQATALVNEVYLRLVDIQRVDWQNRAHFLAMSARLMRRILVDAARARASSKRGGGAAKVTLDEAQILSRDGGPDLVALDDALQALSVFDERKSRVVELRFFGGLSVEETAAALDVSPDTVMRDWRLAKAWLQRELRGSRA